MNNNNVVTICCLLFLFSTKLLVFLIFLHTRYYKILIRYIDFQDNTLHLSKLLLIVIYSSFQELFQLEISFFLPFVGTTMFKTKTLPHVFNLHLQ